MVHKCPFHCICLLPLYIVSRVLSGIFTAMSPVERDCLKVERKEDFTVSSIHKGE